MSKAVWREDLREAGEMPRASCEVSLKEWQHLMFSYLLLDKDTPFRETDTVEGYNLILLHPFNGCLFWGYSADFDFI